MMRQATDTEARQIEQAVDDANQQIRDQLAALRVQQGRLGALLRARETDLYQLRILIDDLSYGAALVRQVASPAPPWLGSLAALQAKEAEIRESMEVARRSLGQINSLIAAVSAICTLRGGAEAEGSAGPLEAAIAGRSLQGQEAERSRLAREVHDGPAQVLANGIMAVEYCERLIEKRPDAVPAELRRIKSTLADGLAEVRRFIFDLRPSALEHEGLRTTLRSYSEDFQRRFGTQVFVRCDPVDEVLAPDQRFVAFRIIQESMQNCRKHAHASRMEICIEHQGPEVQVTIRDNGRGFDLELNRFLEGRYGLQGMRERAESVQGRLVVFSEPGHGTEVRLRIPLETDRTPTQH